MCSVHASPEDAIEIAKNIKIQKTIGMHWGAIMLTSEDSFDPVRFRQTAKKQGYGEDNAWLMKVGETRSI